MKKIIFPVITIVLLAALGILGYKYAQLKSELDATTLEINSLYQKNADLASNIDYTDESYYIEEEQAIDLDTEIGNLDDIYGNTSIEFLSIHFIEDVLRINNGDSWWTLEDGIYYLKSNYYEYASYFNWYFEQPEYLDGETLAENKQSFFWSNYLMNFDRSADNLEILFERHKSTLFGYLSQDMYFDTKLNLYVNSLLAIYDGFENQNYQKVFTEVEASENEYLWTEHFEGLIDTDITETWYRTDDDYYFDNDVFWLYSFWYRRWQEGNMETVADILKEIQTHYN